MPSSNSPCFLDFEFRKVAEPDLSLVCCSLIYEETIEEFWLFCELEDNTSERDRLVARLLELRALGVTLVAFAAEAEASSILSLHKIDPLWFHWIDLFLEYRMLQNHNYSLMHGEQLIDGQVKKTFQFGEKGKQNLAAVAFKLCGKIIDTAHKEKMRNIIIYGTAEEVELNRKDIQAYCTSDVTILPHILEATKKQYLKLIPRKDPYKYFDGDQLGMVKNEARWRGETAVRTAMMVRHGYPINREWARNLTDNIPHIMNDIIQDINEQFPEIQPFNWNPPVDERQAGFKTIKSGKNKGNVVEIEYRARAPGYYSMNQNAVKAWVMKNHRMWPMTDGGKRGIPQPSLKLEHWMSEYSFRHDFPRGNFGAQIVRYLKTAQHLKGFKDAGGSQNTTFWDHVGTDDMVRPYMNPYGAQSSRYQPGSVGFLFLKDAWQRAICQPPEDYAVGAIDFASQEVLLGAILSGDKKLYEAYCSGDIYLAYGKEIGVIPLYGTKKTHPNERDDQKPVILGWQYWITGHGLSKQLKNQTGRHWEPEEAQKLLDKLDETYPVFAEFRRKMIDMYQCHKHLKLLDGWYMWGDNPSERSVANCHVQGMGGVVARKFVQLAQDAGIKVLFPLHDAGYIMYKTTNPEDMDTLARCMREAFIHYFKGWQREWAQAIRLDAKAWGPSYQDGEFITKSNLVVKTSKYHIDSRALSEYNRFHQYFVTGDGQELL
jgi:hypothetical protein